MKYRIDYNLKGHTRFWICDWPSTPNEDNVLTALLRLHAPLTPCLRRARRAAYHMMISALRSPIWASRMYALRG